MTMTSDERQALSKAADAVETAQAALRRAWKKLGKVADSEEGAVWVDKLATLIDELDETGEELDVELGLEEDEDDGPSCPECGFANAESGGHDAFCLARPFARYVGDPAAEGAAAAREDNRRAKERS